MVNVDYPNLLILLKDYLVPGRSESASFLEWYLENYYRLDNQEAIDSVCDQKGDKGIDGIYINEANGSIDIFQSKISQSADKTIGDTQLKQFYGSLSQFLTKEALENLVATGGNAQVVSLINRLDLVNKLGAYKIRGIFLSNIDIDKNGIAFLKQCDAIDFVGKKDLETTFISSSREISSNISAKFDISDRDISEYYADTDVISYIVLLKSTELVQMKGISDQSIFDYNVRGPLGNTSVNRGIVKSIKDQNLHKKFPLFHNGITIVSNSVNIDKDKGELGIETFFVVNGCQSLTTLYNHKSFLTDDLRILTKIIKVPVNSTLSAQITEYSNSQNGVKARDFKSNNTIQIRLQNEFNQHFANEYYYQIKRGETIPPKCEIISNEEAGIFIISFDLKKPWITHRKYQIFEDMYNEIYARPEVDADRIVMLKLIYEAIKNKIPNIDNQLIAKYNLTIFLIMYIVRSILENDILGKIIINRPQDFVRNKKVRKDFLILIDHVLENILVDLNLEFNSLDKDFDYRSRLREERWVKDLSQTVVGTFLKLVKSKRLNSLNEQWEDIKKL